MADEAAPAAPSAGSSDAVSEARPVEETMANHAAPLTAEPSTAIEEDDAHFDGDGEDEADSSSSSSSSSSSDNEFDDVVDIEVERQPDAINGLSAPSQAPAGPAPAPPAERYDRSQLQWNALHTRNVQNTYCYCGQQRTRHEVNLQCHRCRNWFHPGCLRQKLPGPQMLPFTTNYTFACAWCNNGLENFSRTVAGWKQIITTAFANLMLQAENSGQGGHPYFKKDQVVDFIRENWSALCTGRAETATWWATVSSTIYEGRDIYECEQQVRSASLPYRLLDPDPLNLQPLPVVDRTQKRSRKSSSAGQTGTPKPKRSRPTSAPGDGTPKRERKDPSLRGSGSSDKPRPKRERDRERDRERAPRERAQPSAVPAGDSEDPFERYRRMTGQPVEQIYNRDGFRYMLAELDPVLKDQARERLDPIVCLSREDRSASIMLSRDRLTAWSEKGLRMARATHACHAGTYYLEVTLGNINREIETPADKPELSGPHYRIGWARRTATLDAPVGFDQYGYSYRSKTGDRVHNAECKPYGEPFTAGDVIGLLIHLPSAEPYMPVKAPVMRRKRVVIVNRNSLFFEEKDTPEDLSAMPVCKGAFIAFFKNGVSQGIAFDNLKEGHYYPAVSLYRGAQVKMNFGPDFEHSPASLNHPAASSWRPFCERAAEYAAESALQDLCEQALFNISIKEKVVV